MQVTKLSTPVPLDAHRLSDEQLMESIRTDGENALGELIERYWTPLTWYAAGKLAGNDDAEDVAQEVFVRLWENRKRWSPTGSVKSYLFRVARNLVINRVSHRRVRERLAPELVRRTGAPVTPIDVTAQREFQAAFEEVLQALPDRRREAFVLVRTLGLRLDEAAEVMGVSRRTVANHVYMAVTDLQRSLQTFIA